MMNIRDEQETNTTIPGEPLPRMTITSPPEQEVQAEVGSSLSAGVTQNSSTSPANEYEEPDSYVSRWEKYQEGFLTVAFFL